ncbi:MAG: hypothetical protein M1828_005221 [Chrysothrix sp. TS-e1954]|nr:MAG: hypothetical protein M1828_005221 [Chrysothrix sp. TS-e1954]
MEHQNPMIGSDCVRVEQNNLLDCPLCRYASEDAFVLTEHIEQTHFGEPTSALSRSTSHDRNKHASSSGYDSLNHKKASAGNRDQEHDWMPCPEECGEVVPWHQLQEHLDGHFAATLADENDTGSNDTAVKKRIAQDLAEQDYETPGTSQRCGAQANNKYLKSSSEPQMPIHVNAVNCRRRLGIEELGPHANEERMPSSIRKILIDGGKRTVTQRLTLNGTLYKSLTVSNETPGIIPVLAHLLNQENRGRHVWLCHPAVSHISRMKGEGGFCGYRNIMMLLSYIIGARYPGWERVCSSRSSQSSNLKSSSTGENAVNMAKSISGISPSEIQLGGHPSAKASLQLPGRVPGVLELQDMIEEAWSKGFDLHDAKFLTGGIKGTRKYIGTPEVRSLLAYSNIPTTFEVCHDTRIGPDRAQNAHKRLIDICLEYFGAESQMAWQKGIKQSDTVARTIIKITPHPPMYLQQSGHSVTIVGVEKGNEDDPGAIFVFDPAFSTPPEIVSLAEKSRQSGEVTDPSRLVASYRRDRRNLARHTSYEVLALKGVAADTGST